MPTPSDDAPAAFKHTCSPFTLAHDAHRSPAARLSTRPPTSPGVRLTAADVRVHAPGVSYRLGGCADASASLPRGIHEVARGGGGDRCNVFNFVLSFTFRLLYILEDTIKWEIRARRSSVDGGSP